MKSKIMTILCALFPSYCALFVNDGITSAVILIFGTLAGFGAGAIVHAEYRHDKGLKNNLQIGWLIHIVGIFVVIAIKNIF